MKISELPAGSRFRLPVDPNDPWPDCRTLAPKVGTLVACGEGGATVKFGEARTKVVRIPNKIDPSIVREFVAIEEGATVRISAATEVEVLP